MTRRLAVQAAVRDGARLASKWRSPKRYQSPISHRMALALVCNSWPISSHSAKVVSGGSATPKEAHGEHAAQAIGDDTGYSARTVQQDRVGLESVPTF